MCSIVTAFLSNLNQRTDRNTENYIDLGKQLLNIPVRKIVFMDSQYLYRFSSNEITCIIPITRQDIKLLDFANEVKNDVLETSNPSKDTFEYMSFVCSKTDFVARAAELNPFKTSQFVWIDFGIRHIFSNAEIFNKAVENLCTKSYEKIRIAYINRRPLTISIYREVWWFFAGGCFGGPVNQLKKFAQLTAEKSRQVIKEKNVLPWEVNVWTLVYEENKELFDLYYGNHDEGLLLNY